MHETFKSLAIRWLVPSVCSAGMLEKCQRYQDETSACLRSIRKTFRIHNPTEVNLICNEL